MQRRRSNGQESRVTDGAFRACLVAKRCVVNASDAPCYRRLPHTDIQLHSTLPWRHKYEHRFEYSKLTNYDRSFITRSRKSTSTRHKRINTGKGGGVAQVQLLSFLTSAQNRVEWSASGPGRFTPEATPGTHWTRCWVDRELPVWTLWKEEKSLAPARNPANPSRSHYTNWAVYRDFVFSIMLLSEP